MSSYARAGLHSRQRQPCLLCLMLFFWLMSCGFIHKGFAVPIGGNMELWLRIVVALTLVLAQPALGHASDQCVEESQYGPPGSLAVTRGEIIGQSGEHALMTKAVPRQDGEGVSVGYLVSGDRVDFVDACKGYSYVRYHGASRTTTGWIDSRRLQLHGKRFVPLPTDASALCSSAEREVNRGVLPVVKFKNAPDDLSQAYKDDPTITPSNVTPLKVDGRSLAVVQLSEGGSCYSLLASVRTGDLKQRLSPDDAESRNPVRLRFGGNGWAMGVSEDVVLVDAKPLLRSSVRGEEFELSRIDRTGDTQLICHGRLQPLQGKPVVVEGDGALCESLAMTAVPVAMQQAVGHFTVPESAGPDVMLKATQWGMVDLDNAGHAGPIGVINYAYASGAGCGSGFAVEFPLPLDGTSVTADQAQKAFEASYANDIDTSSFSSDLKVRIVRHDGQTYVELLDVGLLSDADTTRAPVQSIWKFSPSGAKRVCKFKTRRYQLTLPSASEDGLGLLSGGQPQE